MTVTYFTLIGMTTDLPRTSKHEDTRIALQSPEFPAILQRAGTAACFAADEFFSARISNPETRRAYGRAVRWFFAWCEQEGLELAHVTPGRAGRFIRSLPIAPSTQKQALAAMRYFFDTLVTHHVVSLNPFHSVPGVRLRGLEGKTPQITFPQARILVAAIDLSAPIGLRDRAMLGTLITTGCRIGALCQLHVRDLYAREGGRVFRFREKLGKPREIPVRRDLDGWVQEYMTAGGLTKAPPTSPLWRGFTRWGGLTAKRLKRGAVRVMLKRRLKAAGLPGHLTPHSFRVMVVTALLSQNVPVEEVQHLVGHSHPSTTQLYDRRRRGVTRGIVEGIPF